MSRKHNSCIRCGAPASSRQAKYCSDDCRRKATDRTTPAPFPDPNPSGKCMCGCGGDVGFNRQTDTKRGFYKQHHVRYLPNHHTKNPVKSYRIDESTGCWVWQWSLNKGYGQVTRTDGKPGMMLAYKVFYERAYGPVPEGLVLDHLCRNTACVNPDHLDPVTQKVNNRRGAHTIFDEVEVRVVRRLAQFISSTEIAKAYGVHTSTIDCIVNRRNWSDVE